jgi:hypothetical protein
MSKLLFLSNIALSGRPMRKMLNGLTHLVIPAVAIKEGVLNNIFYPKEELESFSNTWNGVPVPVNHPLLAGVPVTANSTESEENQNIGRFYNVIFDDSSIKGEIWINIEKAEKLNFGDLIQQLESGELMEVSTGLHAFTRDETGVFNGKSYDRVIESIRPDHLALLPDSEGACSIADGCGAMRTNCGGDTDCVCETPKPTWINRLRGWFGLNIDTSFEDRERMVSGALRETYGKDSFIYTLKTYDGYAIFEMGPSLYKQNYTISDNKVTLQGDRIEVKTEVSYVPVLNETENKNMDPTKRVGLVNALALLLVANNVAAVTDKSKTDLAALPDDMLSNMAKTYKLNDDGTPVVEQPAPAKVEPVIVDNGITSQERQLLNEMLAEKAQRVKDKATQLANVRKDLAPEVIATFNEAAIDAMLVAIGIHSNTNFGPAGGFTQPQTRDAYRSPSVYLANEEETPNKEAVKN